MVPKKYLTVLSDEDVHQVHLATLQVLEEVGLWLPNSEVLQILESAGAKVDYKKQIARYPADMVTAAINRFPAGITWYARNPDNTILMDGNTTHFSMPDSALNIIGLKNEWCCRPLEWCCRDCGRTR
jgi:trimethylamine--corrinoid protein Co-methyltransferase